MRLNVGCPRLVLVDAMNRLKAAYQKWQNAQRTSHDLPCHGGAKLSKDVAELL